MAGDGESQGARGFLERAGLIDTYRRPSPRISPADLLIHVAPVVPPFPVPIQQRYLEGIPPPDRGQTEPWPYPDEDTR